jgi:hypothetical protein
MLRNYVKGRIWITARDRWASDRLHIAGRVGSAAVVFFTADSQSAQLDSAAARWATVPTSADCNRVWNKADPIDRFSVRSS